MGDRKQESSIKSRRWFLPLFSPLEKKKVNTEMVKMLTAEGKLVEIDKAVLEAASKKQRATNKEVYDWVKNPSKENKS